MQVNKNPAMTHITAKEVTAPAGATTTVTIQGAGVTNSANGPGVLSTTLQKGGMVSQHASTVTDFFPMQSADCGVSYPSTVNTPWPVTSAGVVSADLIGASRRRRRPGRDQLHRGRPRRPSVRLEDRR